MSREVPSIIGSQYGSETALQCILPPALSYRRHGQISSVLAVRWVVGLKPSLLKNTFGLCIGLVVGPPLG